MASLALMEMQTLAELLTSAHVDFAAANYLIQSRVQPMTIVLRTGVKLDGKVLLPVAVKGLVNAGERMASHALMAMRALVGFLPSARVDCVAVNNPMENLVQPMLIVLTVGARVEA